MDSTQSNKPENKRHSPPSANERPAEPFQHRTLQEQETSNAEERGERVATGKAIARGGKETGEVPGATENDS